MECLANVDYDRQNHTHKLVLLSVLRLKESVIRKNTAMSDLSTLTSIVRHKTIGGTNFL